MTNSNGTDGRCGHDGRDVRLLIEELLNGLAVGTAVLEAVRELPDMTPEILAFIARAHDRLFQVAATLQGLADDVESDLLRSTHTLPPLGTHPQGQGERECTALANCTVHPDSSAVSLDQIPSYRQT